jgi:hypothetical protein
MRESSNRGHYPVYQANGEAVLRLEERLATYTKGIEKLLVGMVVEA